VTVRVVRAEEVVHEFEGGRRTDTYVREKGPTGWLAVSCRDCGYARRGRGTGRVPKWARPLFRMVRN
jgi:hypothetical protein